MADDKFINARTVKIIEVREYTPEQKVGGKARATGSKYYLGATDGKAYPTLEDAVVEYQRIARDQDVITGYEDMKWDEMTWEQKEMYGRISSPEEVRAKIIESMNK